MIFCDIIKNMSIEEMAKFISSIYDFDEKSVPMKMIILDGKEYEVCDCYENIKELLEYEGEAEQRENICGKCDNTVLKTLHPNYKYCPHCGRKIDKI